MLKLRAPIFAAALFGLAGITAQPAIAADEETLAALDAQLPGDLVNDPSRIDWQS